jgi:hypothetical protein
MLSNELPFILHGMAVNENSHAFLLSTLIPYDNSISCLMVRLRLTKTFPGGIPIAIGGAKRNMLARMVLLVLFKAEARHVCELIDASSIHHVATIND